MEQRFVLISGLGPVCRWGVGIESLVEGMVEEAVTAGVEGQPIRSSRPLVMPPFDLADFLQTVHDYPDGRVRTALAAGAEALDSAYVMYDEVQPERCGVAVASALGDGVRAVGCLHLATVGSKADERAASRGTCEQGDLASILAGELLLRGARWSACGDLLSGAQVMEAAWRTLREDGADMMLSGGVDVPSAAQMTQLQTGLGAARAAQGVALLVLETDRSVERREAYAFCELGSVVCRPVEPGADPTGALSHAVTDALQWADVWEGDVGVVFLSSGGACSRAARQAEQTVLGRYSTVPVFSAKDYVGETFAAGFPMECTLAAHVLSTGQMPPRVDMMDEPRGIQVWVQRDSAALLGYAALVLGCTSELACAAILKAL